MRRLQNSMVWKLANLLRTGETSHGTVLAKAMELCRNELGECNWPNVPEKYWDLAVREMIGE